MRRVVEIELADDERTILVKWSRGKKTQARVVDRAKMILLAADGLQNKEIAEELGTSQQCVGKWRNRFAKHRLTGIEKDLPRGGRKPSVRSRLEATIVRKTTQETPENATQWSVRSMAKAVGTSKATVQRVWRDNGLKPHLIRTFKSSNDKHFAEKVIDVVGLYLNPPERALVLSCDEKSPIQALDRTQKSLPMFPGRLKTRTHDYKRNGTTTLFAAIELAEGRIIAECMPHHRHQEWLKFLKKIDAETPADLDLHLIVDNYATHKHPQVRAWLKRHKRFHMHFIPTSSSWLNIIERWFGKITQERIRNGVFRSVPELVDAITKYIDAHNADPTRFVWTKSAEQILEKAARARATLHNSSTA
jgi:transposase